MTINAEILCNTKNCLILGHTDYKCSCPSGFTPTQTDSTFLYKTNLKGTTVCRRKRTESNVQDKKSYKGTLKGGLKLQNNSGERKHEPLVGIVDDLIEIEEVDVEEMVKEHFRDPKHFGIHVSALETLNPDSVKDDHKEKSIIADMWK